MLTAAWSQALLLLEKMLNPGVFQVWIKPLRAELAENCVHLLAPNEFVAAWVRDKLADRIREALAQVLGQTPGLVIEARPGEGGPAVADGQDHSPARNGVPAQAASPVQDPSRLQGKPQGLSLAEPLGLPVNLPMPRRAETWRFSFDDFVVGPCNELAAAAARSVCRDQTGPGLLFLSSTPGLGKTHLLHAIGRTMSQGNGRRPLNILCLTAEEFTTRLILSIKAREVERFKASVRDGLDVLLLEDVHFFQGKARTQDELLATLKTLNGRGCRVVLTSSFLPKDFVDMDSQLSSRFTSGFLAAIGRPDFDTRRRIVESKARRLSAQVPDDVACLLAERVTSDVRQLESCLNNLVLKARLLNRAISLDLAWQVLDNYALDHPSPDVCHITDFVCRAFDLKETELRSKTRKRNLVIARNTAFFLVRKHTSLSLAEIGEHFGRKHSTVLKGITNIEREISIQTPLGRQLENMIERLN